MSESIASPFAAQTETDAGSEVTENPSRHR